MNLVDRDLSHGGWFQRRYTSDMMHRTSFAICIVISAAVCGLLYAQTARVLPHRWVYISRSLRSDQDVEDIRRLAGIAATNGLNGILFALGLDSIDLKPPEYSTRLEKVKEICKQNRLEIIPNIFSAGYGGGILAYMIGTLPKVCPSGTSYI